MFTQDEKDFMLKVWERVLPTGDTRNKIRLSDEFIERIKRKLEALPVEVSVEPHGDGLDGITAEGLDELARKRTRKRKR